MTTLSTGIKLEMTYEQLLKKQEEHLLKLEQDANISSDEIAGFKSGCNDFRAKVELEKMLIDHDSAELIVWELELPIHESTCLSEEWQKGYKEAHSAGIDWFNITLQDLKEFLAERTSDNHSRMCDICEKNLETNEYKVIYRLKEEEDAYNFVREANYVNNSEKLLYFYTNFADGKHTPVLLLTDEINGQFLRFKRKNGLYVQFVVNQAMDMMVEQD